MNPLLQTGGLIAYDAILPEHVGPALDTLLNHARGEIARLSVPSIAASWDDLVEPLEDATERLARAWGAVEHLSSVVDTPELRAAYNDNLGRITEFWTFLAQDQVIFTKYRTLERSEGFAKLSASRRRVVDNALRDFVLGGAELDVATKKQFGAIQEELASLGQKFAENVLDATTAFEYLVTDVNELAGLPEDVIEAARRCAQSAGHSGYKLTLQAPSYLPVMQYAQNRELRRALYQGYVERASGFGTGQFDNSEVITRILALRREEAVLLGYENFAQLSLVPKMAGSPSEVVSFLDDLARRARPFALKDVEQLQDFAARELGIERLEVWDQRFASEKLRQAEYAFSEQEVKQYFTESRVLEGLFKTIESLFGVRVSADTGPTWHPDVRFFRVENQRKELVAQFYLDLYARTGKRGGAWADASRSRRRRSKRLQTPVSLLVCNFSEPLPGKSAQFTHDEVITLFHEFGHGLHGMLTEVDERAVAGTNGVEWDAVELPSQFMENFCWEWDVVRSMSAHVVTGAELPRALFDKMRAAKNFQAGLDTLRQVEFGLFDMGVHSASRDLDATAVQSILDNVRNATSIIKVPAYNRFQNQFSHIFAGSYAAGYYSYKWAELLSADAYGSFEEEGVLNAATGARFAQEVLARGGSRPALESFVAFRGRKPDIAALLRHNGLVSA